MLSADVAIKISILCVAACVGCGSGATVTKEAPQSYQNLKTLSMAYLQATNSLDRGPKNVNELMPFLKKVGDPAEILRSPVDGEEFIIHWGVDYRKYLGKSGGYPVLAYEKLGKGGRRYVLQIRDVDQVTDEQLAKLPFPPGFKAP